MARFGRSGIPRRTADELRHMRAAGRVVAEMHSVIREAARPGVTTLHLDRLARDVIERRNATSNFFGYHGFPAVICTSVNDEVVHGIPSDRVLLEGDVLSVDCGAIVHGWHGGHHDRGATADRHCRGRTRCGHRADAPRVHAR